MILHLNCNSPNIGSWGKHIYLKRAADRMGMDNVIIYKPEMGQVENILNIEPYNPAIGSNWTASWEIDLMMSRPLDTNFLERCDVIFCAINRIPKQMEHLAHKMAILYQAADAEIHVPKPYIEKKHDVVFYGSDSLDIYSERNRVHKLLQEKGYNIYIGGKGITPEEYSRKACQAKVMFIRSMGQLPDQGEIAQRFFEYYGMGAVLTNWTNDLMNVGVEGMDYCSYRNDTEMTMKLDRLIKDQEFNDYISHNGRLKTKLFNLYEHRLATIFEYARKK